VAGLDYHGTELLVIGDVQFSFVVQESVEFFPLEKVVNQSARTFLTEHFEGLGDFDFAIGAVSNLLFKCRGFGKGSGGKRYKAFRVKDKLIPIIFSVHDLETQGVRERVGNTIFLAWLVN
jgi:hypothetical protein